jgi:hypothetical protein
MTQVEDRGVKDETTVAVFEIAGWLGTCTSALI